MPNIVGILGRVYSVFENVLSRRDRVENDSYNSPVRATSWRAFLLFQHGKRSHFSCLQYPKI